MVADNPDFPSPDPLEYYLKEDIEFWKNVYIAAIIAGKSPRTAKNFANDAVNDLNDED